MEGEGYAVGAADLCAAGVGAPHIRQRLYFVAYAERGAAERHGHAMDGTACGVQGAAQERQRLWPESGNGSEPRDVGDSTAGGRPGQRRSRQERIDEPGATRGFWASAEWIPCSDGKARPVEPGTFPLAHGVAGRVAVVRPGEQAEELHWYNRSGALRGIGNAIVAPLAAAFVKAVMACL